VERGEWEVDAPGVSGILYPGHEPGSGEASASTLADLNLDGVVAAIAGPDDDERLSSLYRTPLHDTESVAFRHEVFADLEDEARRLELAAAARAILAVRRQLGATRDARLRRPAQIRRLDAACRYVGAVDALTASRALAGASSRGLTRFARYLASYVASEAYRALARDVTACRAGLDGLEFGLRLEGPDVEVSRFEGEADYSEEVLATFERFARGAAADYRVRFRAEPAADHVHAQIVDRVARLHPAEFAALDEVDARHAGFLDARLEAFARDLRFYLAYLEFLEPLRAAGVATCYPLVVDEPVASATDAVDVALARAMGPTRAPVPNSFSLDGAERVIVVSGPNQGGKTTFARLFGQLHHLASLGVPVAAASARLGLFDRVLTHFEGEEDATDDRGRLEADVAAVREVLTAATASSVVVLNEAFSSTALADALDLGRRALSRVVALGARCVYVTFVDELARSGPAVVSAVSTVDPDDPVVRTFRIVRAPADGRAYAESVARAFGLTYEQLSGRVRT
jgi:DNA mismatch repair protein MutS